MTNEIDIMKKIVAPVFAKILELNANLQSINFGNIINILVNNLSLLPRINVSNLSGLFSLNPLQSLTTLFTMIWNNDNIRNFLNQNLKGISPPGSSSRKFLEGLLNSVTIDIKDHLHLQKKEYQSFLYFRAWEGVKIQVL